MQVHQILAGAGTGDAITSEALALRGVLRRFGPSEVYAHHRDAEVVMEVRHLSEYASTVSASPDDVVLLVHASIAEPALAQFLKERRERMVLRYHNVTPAAFLAPYDRGFAALLDRGRQELNALRDRTLAAVTVSEYNAQELRALGFRNVAVIPLHVTVDELQVASRSTVGLPWLGDASPVLLFVGRIAPNKRHDRCLEVLHILQTYHALDARMVFVGGRDVPGYRAMLDRAVAEMALACDFTGPVDPAVLAALYRRADVFLCMSEHEGFCAPLVEAMAFDLPIVALARAAVPETLGHAGVVLHDGDPSLAASAVCRIVEDRALRESLIERGRARCRAFAPSVVEAEFERYLGAFA